MDKKWIQEDLFSADSAEKKSFKKNSDSLLVDGNVPNNGGKGKDSARENSGEEMEKNNNKKTNRKNTGDKLEIFSDEAVIFYLGDFEKLRSDLSEMKKIYSEKGSEYKFGTRDFARYFVRTRCKNCTQVDFKKCLNAVRIAIGMMKKDEKIERRG